ncbi:MAG: hypothetical protein Q8904_14170, partial [Bacteroidota bacterium]|nr:hypothetical protein [Bacteroidota bacterium]
LSNSICSILNGKEKLTVDSNFVIELIRTASDQKQKLCLFVKKCTESTYDESFVNTGLNLLGGDYANIALQKGNSSKLTLTNEHKILAEYLERNNFISKQFEEDGMIIINLKNIE